MNFNLLSVFKNTVLLFVLVVFFSCPNNTKGIKKTLPKQPIKTEKKDVSIGVAANQTHLYLPELRGKQIGVVANQTSVIFKNNLGYTHLVDSLLAHGISITKVFAPEHGFRGKADAGEHVNDGVDSKTHLPILSLYGKNKKPSAAQLKNIDVMVFDIQDVGVRFYTYISTLHYIMEACAEHGIRLIVLDRPNPNAHYIDGPILNSKYKSFVGMHPVPVVYGLTIGEYAMMINGQGWLLNNVKCDLKVIPLNHYTHQSNYNLPIKPSPNLPNARAVNLYPSLCFFEGTTVSAGRGTSNQFQCFGSPFLKLNKSVFQDSFLPMPNAGSKYPKHKGIWCFGKDLTQNNKRLSGLKLEYLLQAYQTSTAKKTFFNAFFTKLAGTARLQQQIELQWTEKQIKASWKKELNAFKKIREQYLIYN